MDIYHFTNTVILIYTIIRSENISSMYVSKFTERTCLLLSIQVIYNVVMSSVKAEDCDSSTPPRDIKYMLVLLYSLYHSVTAG